MSGECPPPCVDFSFTRVDQHRAIAFGGFQPEMGTTSDAYMLDMETWVRILDLCSFDFYMSHIILCFL